MQRLKALSASILVTLTDVMVIVTPLIPAVLEGQQTAFTYLLFLKTYSRMPGSLRVLLHMTWDFKVKKGNRKPVVS